jgi:hypothetical protein
VLETQRRNVHSVVIIRRTPADIWGSVVAGGRRLYTPPPTGHAFELSVRFCVSATDSVAMTLS